MGRGSSAPYSPMEEIRKLLHEGRGEEAFEAFKSALAQRPAETGAIAKAATATLLEEYGRFCVLPTEAFVAQLEPNLPAPIASAMGRFLEPPIARTKQWRETLEGVTRERLAREGRAAVTTDDLKTAVRLGIALMRRAKSPAAAGRLARFYIESLAGLRRDRERAARVVKALAASKELPETGLDVIEVFEKAASAPEEKKFEEHNKAWTQSLDAASTSIRETLPGQREVGDPTPENLQKFTDEILAVLRAGLASGDPEDFIDALSIVKEYCPCDPSTILSVAGVEPRVFLGLGLRAKLTTVRALQALGENIDLRRHITKLASSPHGEGRIDLISAIAGGLRHNDFFPYLKTAMKRADTPRLEEAVVDALGRMGNPEGVDLIIENLNVSMKKIIDPAQGRRAKMLLTALGRIGRARGLDPVRRNKIVKQVIAAVGEKDTWVSFHAASEMFSVEPEALERTLRVWAVKQCIRALFAVDPGESLNTSRQNPLGFREPIVTALHRLEREMLPEMLSFAMPHAGNYSGALLAFGELMQKCGDERAMPILETMTRTAFIHEDRKDTDKHYKEMVRDPATGEMRELNRDDVLHSLLFAIQKVGGDPGKRVLLGFADQVQAGQLSAPGEHTSSLLVGVKREAGTLGKREAEVPPDEAIDEKEIEKAVSAARGGLFTSQRGQVAALALLGRARRPDAAGAILAGLHSKDSVVHNAAITALMQMVTPPPSPKQYELLLASMFGEKKSLRGDGLQRLLGVMGRAFPKRPPYDALFAKQLQLEIEDGELRHRLMAAIHAGVKPPAPTPISEGDAPPGGEAKEDGLKLETGPGKLDEIQRKRIYLEERRKWVAGGKKGPEPKMQE